MRADILIIGQGLAGTMLAWELERAGISFAVADCGHAKAATAAGAGMINPITGRRLVKSWRFETFFRIAESTYREIEDALGVSIWKAMRIRRFFADGRERAIGAGTKKQAELAVWIESADGSGWWIRGAARVDLEALLAAARARWLRAGKLRVERAEIEREANRHDLVIDCRGLAGAESPYFGFVPWEFSKGELLELAVEGLDSDVILNRRTWIVPVRPGRALAGATHEPGVREIQTSDAGRVSIETAAREILGSTEFCVTGRRVGIRVNLPDKHPVTGRHPEKPRVGLMNGLGAKGALWAPALARQWVRHLKEGAPFDAEMDLVRFAKVPVQRSAL